MKFPDTAPQWEIVRERGYERLYVGAQANIDGYCINCDSPTGWALLNYGDSPVCSHECADRLWEKYLNRLQHSVALESETPPPDESTNPPVSLPDLSARKS